MSGSSRLRLIAAAATLFVLTVAWRVLTFAGFQNDHYVHLARAQQVLLGDWPVRDFVDPGMPLMYLTSAAAWSLWGGSLGTELLLVAVAFALGAVCTLVVAHRLSGSILVAAAAALLEVLMAPRTYSYPKVLLYAAAAWAIVAVVEAPSTRRVLLLGGLTAVAFLFRHDHGLYIGIAAAAAVMFAGGGRTGSTEGRKASGSRSRPGRLAVLAGGIALMVLPWLAFVAYYQGLIDYVASGVEFSRVEAQNTALASLPRFTLSASDGLVRLRPPSRPSAIIEWNENTTDATRRALEARYGLEPVPGQKGVPRQYYGHDRSPVAMDALADDPHVEDATGLDRFVEWSALDALAARWSPRRLEWGTGFRVRDNLYVWLFYLFHALPLACAVLAWRRRRLNRERWTGESAAVGALAVLAVFANVGLIRANLNVWLPDAIVPAVLLGAWLVPLLWSAAWTRPAARLAARAALTLALVVTVAAVANAGDVESKIDHGRLRLGLDGVRARAADLRARLWRRQRDAGFTPSGVSDALGPFFAYLDRCTSRDDRLVMTWLYPDVYVMAERGFAGGQIAFIEDFYSSAADQERTLARLRRESVPFIFMIQDREARFRGSFDLLSAHIDRRYEAMTDVPVGQTAIRVLVEKDRPAARRDDETGWPCFK